ncbi:B12-binding domain-containing radical SAM protein [Candidatus Auribacterota bacterium]
MQATIIQAPCWTTDSPPYNLALLKAVCKQDGHKITCLDFNIKFYQYLSVRKTAHLYDSPTSWCNQKYVNEIISKYSAFVDQSVSEILSLPHRVIGFTTTYLNIFFSKIIAQKIKDKNKDKIIVFGGPRCFKSEFSSKLLETTPYIDALCYFEGENVLPNLLDLIEKENKIKYLPGIMFRDSNNSLIECPPATSMNNLNSLPFADYSDFDLSAYTSKELPLMTSRGCINRCSFCGESQILKKYRFRCAENIFNEIKHQLSKYPFIDSFFLNDSLINGNINMLHKLCDLLLKNKITTKLHHLSNLLKKRNYNRLLNKLTRLLQKATLKENLYWGGQALIRKEMSLAFLQKLKRAGLYHVSYGLESASPRVLKLMKKKFSPELAEEVIRNTKKAGILVHVNIIIGFPGEEKKDILLTANFLKRNKNFINNILFHPLAISYSSPLYLNKEAFGLKFENELNPNSWYSTKEANNLNSRLKTLEFYKKYITDEGKSIITPCDYYLFIAEDYLNKANHQQALNYYLKAQKLSTDELKDIFIEKKIVSTQKVLASNRLTI